MLFVRDAGRLRHEITQVVVEHEHAQLFCRPVSTLDHVSSPFWNDRAHDHERQRQFKLAAQLKEAFETFRDLRISAAATHPVVSRFIAVDRKNKCEVPDTGDSLKMALHESAVSRDQHIKMTLSKRFE